MAARKGGTRSGTRRKFKKSHRDKGKISLNRYFAKYDIGERALLQAEPAIQKGMYHARFHSRSGTVVDKKGACYGIKIQDGGIQKTVYVHPVHLKRLK